MFSQLPPLPIGLCILEQEAGGARRRYAWLDGEQVGALDFSVAGQQLQVHVLYVSPAHRRCGIATALLASLRQDYPALQIKHGQR